MTHEQLAEEMQRQEQAFMKIHGVPWPNCEVADCEYKAHWPQTKCWSHMRGEIPAPMEQYHGVKE